MKFALVTGGTRGIGQAITRRLLCEGYAVIATYLTSDVSALKLKRDSDINYPGKLYVIKHDMSKTEQIDVLLTKIQAITPSIKLIVFNAGVTDRSNFSDMTLENWKFVFNTNLNVPVFVLQGLLPTINKGGSIIFIGSTMGVFPHSKSLAYGVSKAAINSLVSNLVKFLSPYSLRVNAIIPGFVDTEWHKSKSEEAKNSIKSKISLGYFCPPDNIADLLISVIKNDYINGQCMQIDGGYNYK